MLCIWMPGATDALCMEQVLVSTLNYTYENAHMFISGLCVFRKMKPHVSPISGRTLGELLV